jgi:hypothetical protein
VGGPARRGVPQKLRRKRERVRVSMEE